MPAPYRLQAWAAMGNRLRCELRDDLGDGEHDTGTVRDDGLCRYNQWDNATEAAPFVVIMTEAARTFSFDIWRDKGIGDQLWITLRQGAVVLHRHESISCLDFGDGTNIGSTAGLLIDIGPVA